MVTTTSDISKRIDPAMKQVPKPAKKPMDAAEAAKARQSLKSSSKLEAGDNKLKRMKKGGKVKKGC